MVHSEVMLCENAPQEYQNRAVLWNEVERIEKGANARLAREYEVALPVELNREEQIQLVRDFVRENFVKSGMCADISIHDKEDGNPHAHIMLTTRPIEPDGEWGTKQRKEYILGRDGKKQYDPKKKTYKCRTVKTTDWDSKDFLERSRADWAAHINRELEKKNLPQRVDHRSLEAQGKEQIPTEHLGVAAKNMERRGRKSERGERNKEIGRKNEQIRAISYLQSQTQKELLYIREDVRWAQSHAEMEKLQDALPRVSENEGVLRGLEKKLEKVYEDAKNMKPGKGSEGRTVEYDLREIPYHEYHKSKLIADIADLRRQIQGNLAALEERKQAQQQSQPRTAQGQSGEQKEAAKEKAGRTTEPQKQGRTASPAFDVAATARQLAAHRAAFVRATMQKAGRTSYQENPIYRQQAVQIADLARRVKEQTASIKQLQEEKSALGVFKGREKKALQDKISNFERLRRSNMEKLQALGVSDVSKADEAVKEKNALAAAEQAKVKAAHQNVGAAERAEEAKTAFLSLARSVPPEQRQEVAAVMAQEQTEPEAGAGRSRLEYYQAEVEARHQLDTALKPGQEQEKGQQRSRTHRNDRGH